MVAAAVVCFRFSHLGSCLSWIAFQQPCEVVCRPTMLIPPSSSLHSLLNHSFPALNHHASWVLSVRGPFRSFSTICGCMMANKWICPGVASHAMLLSKRPARGVSLLSSTLFLPSVLIRSPLRLTVGAPPNGWGQRWSLGVSRLWGLTAVSPMTDPDYTNQFPSLQLRKRHKLFWRFQLLFSTWKSSLIV